MTEAAQYQVSESREWSCLYCGYVYDEAAGAPEQGIAPGTRWEDLPDDWCCPMCSAEKVDFEPVK